MDNQEKFQQNSTTIFHLDELKCHLCGSRQAQEAIVINVDFMVEKPTLKSKVPLAIVPMCHDCAGRAPLEYGEGRIKK